MKIIRLPTGKHDPVEQTRVLSLERAKAAECLTCGKRFRSGAIGLTHECINDHRVRPVPVDR